MSALVPRATVDGILAHRRAALIRFEEAHSALAAARTAVNAAQAASAAASPGIDDYNFHIGETARTLLTDLRVPDRDAFLATARRVVDTNIWSYLIQLTEIERLMDQEEKERLRAQLVADPPEPTVETIRATIERLVLDADLIFRRGIANVFSKLDRRFRSHDGWKIGSRIILSYAFNDQGRWNWGYHHRETLIDIERTFMVLEGRKAPLLYGGIVGAVDFARRFTYKPRFDEIECEYFKIRIFKNGNAHLWFTRKDLVTRINKILGEYYGEVIPEDREPDEDTGLRNRKTTIARNFGFFPTPDDVADTVIDGAMLYHLPEDEPLTVLEPEAGTGQLARRAHGKGAVVDCVEIHAERAGVLRAEGIYRLVLPIDFLALQPDPDCLYDRVIMNPPFDRERDIDHVLHALEFLKPDGFLCAVMSAGTEFRETRKSEAFRQLMAKMNARFTDLPPGSFVSVGTYCNTIMLQVRKDGRWFPK